MISHHHDTRRGIAYMLAASFLFALTVAFAKLLSSSMGSVEVTFWRNAVGLFILVTMIFRKPIRNAGGRPLTLLFRGFIGTTALLAFFYTVSETSLSNAIVYSKTEPIFTALLAFFLLGEKPSSRLFLAVITGFIGVVLLNGFELGYLHVMGILTGFLSALAYTSVRSLKTYYDERTVVLSFMLFGTLMPAVLMWVSQYYSSQWFAFALSSFVMPGPSEWGWIVLMGISAAYGQIFMTKAYYFATAGLVSTISYSVVLFATVFGMMLGDDLPDLAMITGGSLIILSGIMLLRTK